MKVMPLPESVRQWLAVRAQQVGLAIVGYLLLTIAVFVFYSRQVGTLIFAAIILPTFLTPLLVGRRFRVPTEADFPDETERKRQEHTAKAARAVVAALFLFLIAALIASVYG